MKILCKLFGHLLDQKITPIYSQIGKFRDERGNIIVYRAHICRRCGKRMPVTAEDAVEKAAATARIAAVMNGSRAQYGLPPICWDD